MKSYVLCRGQFSDEYVLKIKNEINSTWHCIETRNPANVLKYGGNVLFILSGSATQQKEQTVKVRATGGSSIGALTVKLGELKKLFS